MATETEAKLKVASHRVIRARLEHLGARCAGAVLETNHIFDSASRSMLAADEGLRVRRMDAIDGPDRTATLTYKGARASAAPKVRQEIELTIGDADAARSLLKALGFVEVFTFQKRRETWLLEHCHVELDELPYLGDYVEVEGPGTAEVHRALGQLGLADEPIVTASYVALLIDYCRTHNLPTDRLAFPKD
jgi:adenylate cyclase class 2